VDPDTGSGIFLILDPGWKKCGSGINIPNPQHWWYYNFFLISKKLFPIPPTIYHAVFENNFCIQIIETSSAG
jgi:hypothetical protein